MQKSLLRFSAGIRLFAHRIVLGWTGRAFLTMDTSEFAEASGLLA
jgi:hypothetical protein